MITAAASSCNSGIFSTGRMLYTLAQFGQAPRAFGKVNAGHVPATAITVSAAVMLIGVALNYVVPEEVFVWVTSVALVGALWTWGQCPSTRAAAGRRCLRVTAAKINSPPSQGGRGRMLDSTRNAQIGTNSISVWANTAIATAGIRP